MKEGGKSALETIIRHTRNMARRTYNLADEMIARFEALVPPEKRDEVMNQIIERWLEEQRLIELRVNVIEGLNDTENEDLSARV